MPYITMKADILKFTSKDYNKALRAKILYEFQQATKAFIRAAVEPLRIPVDTGMAKGAFLHLGRFFKVAVAINPKRTRNVIIKGRRYTIDNSNAKYYHSPRYGELKTPELGAELTTDPAAVISQEGTNTTFRLSSKVFHLTLNDLIGSPGTGEPWGAFMAGRLAFLARIEKLSKKLPPIKKFMLRSRLSVGRGGISSDAFAPFQKQTTIGET